MFADNASQQPAPTYANAVYRPPEWNILDFWKATGTGARPLLVNIHGGGWITGDKRQKMPAFQPFLDGHGRVGRLLITLFLMERQILPTPLLSLSAFIEAARRDYYDGQRGVSERGEWNDWIEYFLLGVARMSEDALSRATHMNARLAAWQKKVSGDSTNAPLRVVELLAANPFVTAKGAAEKLDVGFTTAQRAIERLKPLKIMKQFGDAKGDRVYCANTLLDILEEPAQLTPGKG